MTLAVHTITRQEWVGELVDAVLDCLTPLGFIGPLGYRWWEPTHPDNGFDGWQIAVFPTPNEVEGGPKDGQKFVSGFDLDVALLTAAFQTISSVAWSMPTSYNGDLDGPELRIEGRFAGTDVWLRVFSIPPPDEPVACVVTPSGVARLRG